MYGRLHQRKLKEQDYIMSCQKARIQLNEYIDLQAKRVNIDSAKKRAVLQHMDYQGFRQMVLGANIFPTKSAELYSFSKGQNSQLQSNKLFKQNQEQNGLKQKRSAQQTELFSRVQGRSQLQCASFRQFKKKFNSLYLNSQIPDQTKYQHLYNLLKIQNHDHLIKIFNIQCQANILVKIVNVFEFIIKYLRQNDLQGKVIKQIAYQIKFFQTVLKIKNMREMNLEILSKKQRNKIVQFLKEAGLIMRSNDKANNSNPMGQTDSKQHANQALSENNSNKQVTQTEQDDKFINELVKILQKK